MTDRANRSLERQAGEIRGQFRVVAQSISPAPAGPSVSSFAEVNRRGTFQASQPPQDGLMAAIFECLQKRS